VSVLLLAHEIDAFTMMSPAPLLGAPGPLNVPSAFVCRVTLVVARLDTIVAAAAASTVRVVGSTSHMPDLPAGADVST
jgi:hypothetical protein